MSDIENLTARQAQSPNPDKPPRDRKAIFKLSILGALAASLCCLTPVVLVLIAAGLIALFGPEIFGAASKQEVTIRIHRFTDLWYDNHKWAFRIVGLAIMGTGLLVYFRRRGICTLDSVKRHRNRIINVTLLTATSAVGIYLAWNYVVLHYWGIAVGLPW